LTSNPKYIYIRNDDVYKVDDKLKAFFDTLEGLPVSNAVIPSKVTSECVKFLDDNKADIIQHGSVHKKGFDNIRDGATLMNERFDDWTMVYAPPWHEISHLDMLLLDKLGYDGISSDSEADRVIDEFDLNLYSFPINIELRLGAFHRENYKDIEELVGKYIETHDLIGILLHHSYIDDFVYFSDFVQFLKGVNAEVIDFRGAIDYANQRS
jgi:hypothetical protein